MDLKQLKYFVAVVEENSFTKAAKILHISQPTLSLSIKSLEQQLNTQLFERNTRAMQITDGGQLLYDRAKKLLLKLSIVEKEIVELNATGKGEVHLSIIESTQNWIPKVIKNFKQSYPTMKIRFTEITNKKHVIQSLRSYKTHLSITNQLVEEEDIEFIPIYTEKFLLIMHEDNKLSSKQDLSFQDLKDEPLIITKEGYQTRVNILEAFEAEGVEPTIMFEIERFETAWKLVEENLGIAFIPKNYAKDVLDSRVVIKEVDSSNLTRTVYLTYMKHRYFPAAIRELIGDIEGNF
ncbi:LysR family transcriptional regulator [Sporosarcina jiandibaonis]|uniref:LysR family transcriptional regulator n=1 Tax=Sporosarcina jiandibaonis TaxID=2715535 RepID=UPI0015579F60|nr:LysR family transcriptional regulator [Sporosarcina jiandibaonis]